MSRFAVVPTVMLMFGVTALGQFNGERCDPADPPLVRYHISCIVNKHCFGHLLFFPDAGFCVSGVYSSCAEYEVQGATRTPATSINVGPGNGFCGDDDELICVPDFLNVELLGGPTHYCR